MTTYTLTYPKKSQRYILKQKCYKHSYSGTLISVHRCVIVSVPMSLIMYANPNLITCIPLVRVE